MLYRQRISNNYNWHKSLFTSKQTWEYQIRTSNTKYRPPNSCTRLLLSKMHWATFRNYGKPRSERCRQLTVVCQFSSSTRQKLLNKVVLHRPRHWCFPVDFVKVLGAPFYRVLYETFWLLYDQEDSITWDQVRFC